MISNQNNKRVYLKWAILTFSAIVLISLLAARWEENKALVLSMGLLLSSPLKFPITAIPYIVLLMLFVLSVMGILRSDKEDDVIMFYRFVFLLFISAAGIASVFYLSFLFSVID